MSREPSQSIDQRLPKQVSGSACLALGALIGAVVLYAAQWYRGGPWFEREGALFVGFFFGALVGAVTGRLRLKARTRRWGSLFLVGWGAMLGVGWIVLFGTINLIYGLLARASVGTGAWRGFAEDTVLLAILGGMIAAAVGLVDCLFQRPADPR